MKLISARDDGREKLGFMSGEEIFFLHELDPSIPETMEMSLADWDRNLLKAREVYIKTGNDKNAKGNRPENMTILAPVTRPGSLRDGYAFRQHVETARRNRGVPMTPVFDEFPVFYFGNHRTVSGPGEITCMPDHFEQLDFELEVAAVICRHGKNIRAEDAEDYIGGLMIMNDFSARRLQMEEMQLNLGPAKGKDFATTTGPWLTTTDELESYLTTPTEGHTGRQWNLHMEARVNERILSSGSLKDMQWTFAELIERAAYGVDLFPGVIIGSGTVGTGCLLELNGTGKLHDPSFRPQWLQEGDLVELEVQGLGILQNRIRRSGEKLSLFSLKK